MDLLRWWRLLDVLAVARDQATTDDVTVLVGWLRAAPNPQRVRQPGTEAVNNWRAGLLRSPRPANPEQVLNVLARPTLLLHGARDLYFPVQVARRLHAAVPHSELAIIDNAGHATHFEKRTEWTARLRAFLLAETAAADLADLPTVNKVYAEVFPVDPPARSAAVVDLASGGRFSVDAIAVVPD